MLSAALIGAAPASAWYADGGEIRPGVGEVRVVGLPGEEHDVTAIGSLGPSSSDGWADSVLIRDTSARVTAPPAGEGQGCSKVDDHAVRCRTSDALPGRSIRYLSFDYRDSWIEHQHNVVDIPVGSAPTFLRFFGSPGRDVVTTHDAGIADMGAGDDEITLDGVLGNDIDGVNEVLGGEGVDRLYVRNNHREEVSCGPTIADLLRGDPDEANADCEFIDRSPWP